MRFSWDFYRSGSGRAIDTRDKDARTRKSKWQTGEKYTGIFIAPPCVWLCFPERPLFFPPRGKCAHAQVNENRSTFRRRSTCPNFAAVRPSTFVCWRPIDVFAKSACPSCPVSSRTLRKNRNVCGKPPRPLAVARSKPNTTVSSEHDFTLWTKTIRRFHYGHVGVRTDADVWARGWTRILEFSFWQQYHGMNPKVNSVIISVPYNGKQ